MGQNKERQNEEHWDGQQERYQEGRQSGTRQDRMCQEKRRLRKHYLQQRDAIGQEEREAAGRKIKERVLAMEQVKAAETIFLYAACKSEVPTKELFQELLVSGKRVALPKVDGNRMDFYEVTAWEELLPGYRGILEPESREAVPVLPQGSDVMLLPGAVFDRKGGRIGYGGGYYDRYLQELEVSGRNLPCLIGICCERQLCRDILPMEAWDRQVDCVVTEQGILGT